MTNESLSALKQICGSSGLPCAIADGELNVIWRNKLAETNRSPLKKENLLHIFSGGFPVTGMVCLAEAGSIHRFNVLKAESTEAGCLYIIEHLGSDELKALLEIPKIRDYMKYLCSRIRESAGVIAVCTDEIDIASGAGGRITEQLNAINKNVLLILREVIDPEQLYYVLDPGCDDATICVSDEILKSAEEAGRALGKSARISCKVDKGIFTRINRGVFETIISGMTASCCRGIYPKELEFSCKAVSSDRAAVTVRSADNLSRKTVQNEHKPKKKGSELYFDYLCSAMCDKYGAVFTRQEQENGYSFRMEIPVISSDAPTELNAPGFSLNSGRFCAMTLSLAELCVEDRYTSRTAKQPVLSADE